MGRAALTSASFQELRFAADPVAAPDGRSAVLVVSEVVPAEGDPGANGPYTPPRYRSRLWRAAADGALAPLSHTRGRDSAPAFAPDGRTLAFLRRESSTAAPQLQLLPLGGGEARPLTRAEELPAGVEQLLWLPASDALLLLHRGAWSDRAGSHGLPRRIARSGFRMDARGFVPDAPAVIERIDVDGGVRTPLTELRFDPLGWELAPDGSALYVLAPRSERERRERRAMLWRLDFASGEQRELLPDAAVLTELAVAPGGDRLALVGPTEPDRLGAPSGVWLLPTAGGTPRLVSGDHDLAPSPSGDSRLGPSRYRPRWLDDDALLVALGARGRANLARLDAAEGQLTPVTDGDRAITGFDLAAERAWFVAETPERPAELFTVPVAGGAAQQVGDLNGAFRERYRLAPTPTERSCRAAFEGATGPEVAYWLLEPATPRPDRALVLQVHGGPHTAYGYGFSFEFQLLAARGYAVVYGNPRGSASYGGDFANAILGRYGTVDAADVLAIADDALARHDDPQAPMHLTGGSYGGFMTTWLLGETDRFASAVTQRSICNWLSFYGSSDIGPFFAEREVGGRPWSDLDTLWQQSPLRRVERITTPLLVLHAEEDWRCPLEQGVQLFQALERLERDTELLLVPGDGHDLSRSGRPDRRVARLDAILDWFARHPQRR